MLSRRTVILLSLASAMASGLGFAVWRRVNSPAERNRRVVLRWLDQRIDMPYNDGYTLNSAITDFYRRTGGRHGTGFAIFTDFNAGGRARMEKARATPIHYSSRNFPSDNR